MNRYTPCFVVSLLAAVTASALHGAQVESGATVFDEDVSVVSFEDMEYPPLLRAARVEGAVVIAVTLDDNGNVVAAAGISGPHHLIKPTAANATKWKFKPNRQKRAVIVYDFDIDDGHCHDRTRSLFLLKHRNFASIKTCEVMVGG